MRVSGGTSGLDVAAHLERGFPNLPILYISGHVESLAMQSISQQSPDCVLFKPFTMGELRRRLDLLPGAAGKKAPGRATTTGQRTPGSQLPLGR